MNTIILMWKPSMMEREKTMGSSESSIPLLLEILQENNRESIKLLKVWNSYTWRKSLIGKLFSFACFLFLSPSCKSLFYLVFILYLLEPKGWDKVARCCILIGGGWWWEKPKIVSMPIVLRCMHLVHFCVH